LVEEFHRQAHVVVAERGAPRKKQSRAAIGVAGFVEKCQFRICGYLQPTASLHKHITQDESHAHPHHHAYLFVQRVVVTYVIERGRHGFVVVLHQQLGACLGPREEALVLHAIHVPGQPATDAEHQVENVSMIDHPLDVIGALAEDLAIVETTLIFLAPRIAPCTRILVT
jgi:hypothetical protein